MGLQILRWGSGPNAPDLTAAQDHLPSCVGQWGPEWLAPRTPLAVFPSGWGRPLQAAPAAGASLHCPDTGHAACCLLPVAAAGLPGPGGCLSVPASSQGGWIGRRGSHGACRKRPAPIPQGQGTGQHAKVSRTGACCRAQGASAPVAIEHSKRARLEERGQPRTPVLQPSAKIRTTRRTRSPRNAARAATMLQSQRESAPGHRR